MTKYYQKIMKKIWQFSSQIGESMRDTIRVHIRNLLLAGSYLIAVLCLAVYQIISLQSLFVLSTILYILFSIIYGIRVFKIGRFSIEKRKNYLELNLKIKSGKIIIHL